ncbi:YggS family pyridoxal phosphate-dependent enzyme [bacterium]|nr:YggS family pyridoxal phosphate-dependent enzyme [bacterium]
MGSQRKLEDVTIIAVSKGHSTQAIRQFYNLGLRDFGESYAQEFAKKAEELADLKDLRWHFIGHLQSNKVRKIISWKPIIHALDRQSLLEELCKYAHPADPLRVLLQLQIDSADVNKSGCARPEADELCQRIASIPGIHLEGFMGIGPDIDDHEKLKWLYEGFSSTAHYLWEQYSLRDPSRRTREAKISLGMSGDLEIALRCGSNIVRIGTALFGPRPGRSQAT